METAITLFEMEAVITLLVSIMSLLLFLALTFILFMGFLIHDPTS